MATIQAFDFWFWLTAFVPRRYVNIQGIGSLASNEQACHA